MPSSLAEQTLTKVRARMPGQLHKLPTSVAPKISMPPTNSKPKSLEVVVEGPVNHFMFLEGRTRAIDMVTSLRASPAPVVIERLAGAATDRPGSYAAGIKSVIKVLKEAIDA